MKCTYIYIGCNKSVEDALVLEARREPIDMESFIRRLKRDLLKKSPPEKKLL